jgi:PAS domain S-box-containing protein
MEEKKTKGQLIDELSQLRHRIGELEASESEFSALREALSIVYDAIDSTVGGVLIANLEGKISYVNPSFMKMFEYSDKQDVLGNDVADLFASRDIKSLADVTSMIDLTKGQTGEFIVVRSDSKRFYVEVSSSTVTNDMGQIVGAMASFVDITQRKQTEMEREDLIRQLQTALAKIKTLRGLVPICASCKKIRDDKGFWHQVEVYVRDHSAAQFSHSICPECARSLYPDSVMNK